ncbi:MAG: hypothetical protein Q4F00_12760 [bacterium]|nr:hypothetical protein [bacterium]
MANFNTMDSLNQVQRTLDEARKALNEPNRTIANSDIPDVLGAVAGVAPGAGLSLAALYGLGVTGFSAAGITSGLAAAGAWVGGGMVAGVGVLAAPVAIGGIVGYGIFAKRKHKKLMQVKQETYTAVIEKYNEIIQELHSTNTQNQERIEYLKSIVTLLEAAMKDLKSDLNAG